MEVVLPLSEKLLVYGPLGIMTMISIIVAVVLFKLLIKERAAHDKEMQALSEKFIEKSEIWMSKYNEQAMSQDVTIKALKGLVDDLRRG